MNNIKATTVIRKQLIHELEIRENQILNELTVIKIVTDMENKRTIPEPMHFDGPEYNPDLDQKRLTGQIKGIYDLMKNGRWLTLFEIAAFTGYPEASISAQLRHLRKERFGNHIVEKRRRGDGKSGLFEYQLIPNTLPVQKKLF